MRWIAIDPGVRTGYAIVEEATITECGTCTMDDLMYNRTPPIDYAVVEIPRVYPTTIKWKGDPQIIVMLAFECGRVVEWFDDYVLVGPSEWGGNAPKGVKWKRTMAVLTPGELAMVPRRVSEHARDALGIACWAMGRF